MEKNKTVSVVLNKTGLYLMDVEFVDWTDQWADAWLFASREEAVKLCNFLGISMAKVETYEVTIPPLVPEETKDFFNKYYVYFIVERDKDNKVGNFFKVGFTDNPEKRVKQLQTGNAQKLGLNGFFEYETEEGARNAEKVFHKTFEKLKTNGEWFRMTDDVLHFLSVAHEHNDNFIRYFS